jgi:hypothetical protein
MRSIRSTWLFLLLAVCLSTMACSGRLFQSFGRIDLSVETTRAFENYSVDTDFRYFVSGSDTYTNAIIGLHRDYRIDPKSLWKEVDMTTDVMQKIVGNMREKTSSRLLSLYGFELLDPQGKPIGVWYSIQTARTCLQIKADGTVRLDTPDLDTYEQMNGDTGAHLENG